MKASRFEEIVAGANEVLTKSYAKVVIDEIETARILERERMEKEEREAERKLRAFHRFYKEPK